jgi:hypothetical protein
MRTTSVVRGGRPPTFTRVVDDQAQVTLATKSAKLVTYAMSLVVDAAGEGLQRVHEPGPVRR